MRVTADTDSDGSKSIELKLTCTQLEWRFLARECIIALYNLT